MVLLHQSVSRFCPWFLLLGLCAASLPESLYQSDSILLLRLHVQLPTNVCERTRTKTVRKKTLLGRLRLSCEDNIKTYIKQIMCEGVDWV
jgi:hypothetical protein